MKWLPEEKCRRCLEESAWPEIKCFMLIRMLLKIVLKGVIVNRSALEWFGVPLPKPMLTEVFDAIWIQCEKIATKALWMCIRISLYIYDTLAEMIMEPSLLKFFFAVKGIKFREVLFILRSASMTTIVQIWGWGFHAISVNWILNWTSCLN